MQLSIAFTPAEVALGTNNPEDIYVVVDVIRATTSITILCDKGAKRLYVAETIKHAQQAAQKLVHCVLCGETEKLSKQSSFDLSNSPAQLIQADVLGKEVILTTTNGTRAFFACPPTSLRLAGCFYNAQAVMTEALHHAQERSSNIIIVCSGEFGTFALDDSYCAGFLAKELTHKYPEITLHESVYAAFALCQTYTPSAMLTYCRSAQSVRQAGFQEDLDLCLVMNASESVAQASGIDHESGLLILEPNSFKGTYSEGGLSRYNEGHGSREMSGPTRSGKRGTLRGESRITGAGCTAS